MEKYLLENDCMGISVSSENEIIDLGFAGDFVYLSDSPLEVNRKLKALHSYCYKNS